MQYFLKNLFSTIVGISRIALALMFRSVARAVAPVSVISVFALASMANAQIAPNFPNPTAAPNPLTKTLSIFTSNMQDKIMNAANMMPESKYSYRPTKEVRSFGEILTHIADISYFLCSTAKGEAPPPQLPGKLQKPTSSPTSKPRSPSAMAHTPASPMRTLMIPRTSSATRRTRCSF